MSGCQLIEMNSEHKPSTRTYHNQDITSLSRISKVGTCLAVVDPAGHSNEAVAGDQDKVLSHTDPDRGP